MFYEVFLFNEKRTKILFFFCKLMKLIWSDVSPVITSSALICSKWWKYCSESHQVEKHEKGNTPWLTSKANLTNFTHFYRTQFYCILVMQPHFFGIWLFQTYYFSLKKSIWLFLCVNVSLLFSMQLIVFREFRLMYFIVFQNVYV